LLHCAVFKEHHANAVHVLCFASMLCVACIAAASLFERDFFIIPRFLLLCQASLFRQFLAIAA